MYRNRKTNNAWKKEKRNRQIKKNENRERNKVRSKVRKKINETN